jgi:hypothetical protein
MMLLATREPIHPTGHSLMIGILRVSQNPKHVFSFAKKLPLPP